LRDGLVWSDARRSPPRTASADQALGRPHSMGQKMLASVTGFEAVDAKTFKMKMKEP
jgi:peptide/nickel transport system substrate-binding protein